MGKEYRRQEPGARRCGGKRIIRGPSGWNRKEQFFLSLVFFFLLLAPGFWLLTPSPVSGAPSTLQDQFNQANDAYFNRDFDKAIKLYSDLEKRGVISGDLFYNLANTYYRQGKVGWAVYYYLKALRYHPRDRDLAANHRYVTSKRVDQIEEPLLSRLSQSTFFWMDLMTNKELLIVAVVFYWLFFIVLTLRITRKRFVLTLMLIVLGGLNLLILPTAVGKFYSERLKKTGVIVAPVSAVYSEPAQGAIKLFDLHEGTVATVIERANGFAKIRLADGKRGWVSENDLKEIS